jgi:FkbM family methyltransferase
MNIVFACGNAFEEWNPLIARERGVGGSELAVVEMAKRLAAAGHGVTVYTNCGAPARYDGADWRPTRELLEPPAPIACDVLVLWRNASLALLPIQARARVLWVHDVHPNHLTTAALAKIDRVLALSQWQRAVLVAQDRIPPAKTVVDRGGLDVEAWAEVLATRTAISGRAVYTSCPDRGLHTLLTLWPRIRERVSFAELHVTNGFDNAIAQAKETENATRLAELEDLRALAKATAGVTLHGRMPRAAYMGLVASASVWLYPTHFDENSPATAMEAVTCGHRIVASSRAGLRELVGDGLGALLEGDPGSPAYQDEFVRLAAQVLALPALGAPRLNYARQAFGWDALVPKWEALFAELLGAGRGVDLRVKAVARTHLVLEPAAAALATPTSDERGEVSVLEGTWLGTRGEASFRVECPPDMEGHVLEVLRGAYNVPGLEFATPPRILDVGACVGDFGVWAAHRWPGADIRLYEPNPRALAFLRENAARVDELRHRLVPVAVRGQAGNATLHFGRHNLGEATFHGTETHQAGSVEVDCVAAGSLPDCDVLKIDTEGCEVEILCGYLRPRCGAGAKGLSAEQHRIFDAHLPKAVLLEFHSAADRVAIDEILRGLGYRLVHGRIATADMGVLCYVRRGAL